MYDARHIFQGNCKEGKFKANNIKRKIVPRYEQENEKWNVINLFPKATFQYILLQTQT